ncbi:hypothetical protein M0Q97_06860, partial [Candidatus Dojkabacteria bacterium]|nr:hypothetical protein [Candidatus Dojkabacteria bacterium]
MILTETVKIKVNSKNIEYLKSKGYDCDLKNEININTSDLSIGSHIIIKVKCDVCGTEKELKYQTYYKNYINCNYYSCSNKCSKEKSDKSNIEKYGVNNIFKTEDFKNNNKNINLIKYGVDSYSKTEECKLKVKHTNMINYGVEYPTQNTELMNKISETNYK